MLYCLNIIGLIFDIVGVIWLFKYISVGLKPLPKLEVNLPSLGGFDSDVENALKVRTAFDDIVKAINKEIDTNNIENKRLHNKSKWGLILIIIGFFFNFPQILLHCFKLPLNRLV